MFSVLYKLEQAGSDNLWSVAWVKSEDENGKRDYIAAGARNAHLKLWQWSEADGLRECHDSEPHRLSIVGLHSVGSEGLFASSSQDCVMKVWRAPDMDCLTTIDASPFDSWMVAFSPDGRHLATGAIGGKVTVYDVGTGEQVQTISTPSKFIMCLCYTPCGTRLVAGSSEGNVHVLDVESGRLVGDVEAHMMPVRSVALAAGGRLLATASDDRTVKLFDLANVAADKENGVDAASHEQLVGCMSGHGGWVLACDAPSPNAVAGSGLVATASSDKTVKLWDVGERRCVHTFAEHDDMIFGLRFHENGSRLASASDDKAVCIYSIA